MVKWGPHKVPFCFISTGWEIEDHAVSITSTDQTGFPQDRMPEGQAMSKMMNLRHQAQLSACSTVTWINSWCFKIQRNVVQVWWTKNKNLDVLLWWVEFRCFSSEASLPGLNSGQTLFWTTSIPGCGPGASMIVPYEGSPLQCWHRLTLTQGYGLCVFAKKIYGSCVYSPEKSTEAAQATQLLLLSSLLDLGDIFHQW